jgi:hypothetical protein
MNSTSIRRQLKIVLEEDLMMSKKQAEPILKKLYDYIYVEKWLTHFRGSYIRWILIEDQEDKKKRVLNKGGFFCEVIVDKDGTTWVTFRSITGKHFRILEHENLFFKKMTTEERILLAALDSLRT